MNCRKMEQWILLRRAGELPDRRQARVERHLTACAACRAFATETERIEALARTALRDETPQTETLAAICARAEMAALRGDLRARPPLHRTGPAWRPLLAAAALLAVCLGGWLTLHPRQAAPVMTAAATTVAAQPHHDTELFVYVAALDDVLALTSEDLFVFERVSDLADDEDVDRLDRELLMLEGLAI